jgi:hypothetical protein
LIVTAKAAAKDRMAPAMNARITVSRVDMKILDSPASTILLTNSEGIKYATATPLFLRFGTISDSIAHQVQPDQHSLAKAESYLISNFANCVPWGSRGFWQRILAI